MNTLGHITDLKNCMSQSIIGQAQAALLEAMEERQVTVAEAWFMAPVSKRIVEFKMSLAKEPPIRLGTPDPYVPKK